jgi:hypothetical protein
VEHKGILPEDFPNGELDSATFFLTASRRDSYYTRIKQGPTTLKLKVGDQVATATSEKVAPATAEPVPHAWKLRFVLERPVDVGPGPQWHLFDGDNNIYSAALLHANSKPTDEDRRQALLGCSYTAQCKYAKTKDLWYSSEFVIR